MLRSFYTNCTEENVCVQKKNLDKNDPKKIDFLMNFIKQSLCALKK